MIFRSVTSYVAFLAYLMSVSASAADETVTTDIDLWKVYTMNDLIDAFVSNAEQASLSYWIAFGLFFLVVYFLPTLLAAVFNRQHLIKIALLNVPAGFSLIAWGALIVWAVTGRMGDRLKQWVSSRHVNTSR